MNIVLISGSPRKGSLSNRVALHLKGRLDALGQHKISVINLQETQLPFVQQVWSNPDAAPEQFRDLAAQMFEADAYLMVSPEYNGSCSPALRNLFDHFPKRMHKTFGIAVASPGPLGGIRAGQQAQLMVGALFGRLCPYMLVTPAVDKKFDEQGNLIDPAFESSIDTFMTEFLWHAER